MNSRNKFLILVLAVAITMVLLLLPLSAFAQEAQPNVLTAKPLVDFLTPYVLELLGFAITLIVGWIAKKFSDYTKINIDLKYQEMIGTAAMTGAAKALAEAGKKASEFKVQVDNDVVYNGVKWIETIVPHAVSARGLGPEELRTVVVGKIQQMAAAAPVVAPGMITGEMIAPGAITGEHIQPGKVFHAGTVNLGNVKS